MMDHSRESDRETSAVREQNGEILQNHRLVKNGGNNRQYEPLTEEIQAGAMGRVTLNAGFKITTRNLPAKVNKEKMAIK
jgi:hypothetical protein